MPDINAVKEQGSEGIRSRYLDSDKSFNIKKHLEQIDKEDQGGLKGIEIRQTAKQLGKDDFLKLLITQLSHQDPTSPVKDQDFIAQMAQFSSLEQMKNISSGISKMEARQSYSLVGKIVSGPDFVNGETITGMAGALFFDSDGKSFVRVNGKTIDVNQITLITDPEILGEKKLPLQEQQPVNTPVVSRESPGSVKTGDPKKEKNSNEDEFLIPQKVNNEIEYPGIKTEAEKGYNKIFKASE